MRKRFVYDIESDGFVRRMTRVHCLVLWDLDTQELLSFRNDGDPENAARLAEGVRMLNEADFRAGHNIIKFDEPALAKIYPFFVPNREGVVFDTLIATRLIWPNITDSDKGRVQRGTLKGRNIGSHSLDSWGQRLGCWKGDYSDKKKLEIKAAWEAAGNDTPLDDDELNRLVWEKWTPDMQSYCDQDVIVNTKLFAHCNKKGYAQRALDDEMAMAILCQKIEENGFPFNEKAAETLYVTLGMERAVIDAKLRDFFGLWVEPAGAVKTPSVSNAAQGYWGSTDLVSAEGDYVIDLHKTLTTASGALTAAAKREGYKKVFSGYPFTPIKIIEFAPTNRFHIANRLKALYGWEPLEYTPGGEPKVDDEILQGLPFEAAPLLCEYFVVNKRISALAEGKQAWLKLVYEGRIHGSYNTVGAVTRRATHSRPNIGQVPGATHAKDGSAVYGKAAGWGTECRELFGVPEGWVQVGTDASGLELRCLAHFMSRWDDGEYAKLVTTGDVHTANQIAAGLPTRDNAKTFIYAFLYGAGDEKIGSIVGGTSARGKLLKSTFLSGLPALGSLVTAVKTKAKQHKQLTALDGGRLHVRSDHSALNTLLQSAGALICKRWLVTLEKELQRLGYKHGWDGDYAFLAWVHDEAQIAARSKELAVEIGELSRWAMKETEKYFGFRCPLDIDFKIGHNWAQCH